MLIRLIIFIFLISTLNSCAKNKESIYEPSKLLDPYNLYNEGLDAFKKMIIFTLTKNSQRLNLILQNRS